MEAPHPSFEAARLDTINELGLVSIDYERAYDDVVALTRMATGLPISAFSVIDRDRQFFKASQGLDVRETPRDVAFCAWAIVQDDLSDILVVEDPQSHPHFEDNELVTGEFGLRFYAGIPIRAPNNLPVGTLCVIDKEQREFTPEVRAALEHGKRLLEDSLILRSQAIQDHLTGLFNRRYFDVNLGREWRRSYRKLIPITVLMVDLDHFKAYNDTYGHQAGDKLLKKIGTALKGVATRGGDVVARYGGEEFVLVLPETKADGAAQIAERVLDAVRDLAVPHSGSATGFVTTSVGGAIADDQRALRLGVEALVGLADDALYEAKDAGRNTQRIKVLKPEPAQPTEFDLKRETDV